MGFSKLGINRSQGFGILWVMLLGSLGCLMSLSLYQINWTLAKSSQAMIAAEQNVFELEKSLANQSLKFQKLDINEKISTGKWIGFVPDTLQLFSPGSQLFEFESQTEESNYRMKAVESQRFEIEHNPDELFFSPIPIKIDAQRHYPNTDALFPWLDEKLNEQKLKSFKKDSHAVMEQWDILGEDNLEFLITKIQIPKGGYWQSFIFVQSDHVLALFDPNQTVPVWHKYLDGKVIANAVVVRDSHERWGIMTVISNRDSRRTEVVSFDPNNGQRIEFWPMPYTDDELKLVPLDLQGNFYFDAFLMYGDNGDAKLCYIQGGCITISNSHFEQHVSVVRGTFGISIIRKNFDRVLNQSIIVKQDIIGFATAQDWSMQLVGSVSDVAVREDKFYAISFQDGGLTIGSLISGELLNYTKCSNVSRKELGDELICSDFEIIADVVDDESYMSSCHGDDCYRCKILKSPTSIDRKHWKLELNKS